MTLLYLLYSTNGDPSKVRPTALTHGASGTPLTVCPSLSGISHSETDTPDSDQSLPSRGPEVTCSESYRFLVFTPGEVTGLRPACSNPHLPEDTGLETDERWILSSYHYL